MKLACGRDARATVVEGMETVGLVGQGQLQKVYGKLGWRLRARRPRHGLLLFALGLGEFLLGGLDDLLDGVLEGDGDVPGGVVLAHFGEVGDVADVVADAVFLEVLKDLWFSGEGFGDLEGFEDGTGVGASAADVVDFAGAWCLDEFADEAGDVVGVDVITDLFALVAEDFVFAADEIALDQVGEEAVEFDAGVIGAGEAAAAEAAGGHAEVAAVFLDHDVRGGLGGTEEGVFGLIDGKVLGDAVGVAWIGVVPAGLEFGQGDGVWFVTIDLVGGHVGERGLRAGLARGFEEVEGADRVGIEVVEGDGGGAVVGGLGSGVDDGIRLDGADQFEEALAVADVDFVVVEGGAELIGEAGLVPAGIALGAEEGGALVVIDAMDGPAEGGEVDADFGADEAGGAGDEEAHLNFEF